MTKFFEYLDKNKTTVNLICALLAMGTNLVINFFLSPFIVEKIGVEANGFIQLATNFTTIASLVTIALNSMAGRFISLNYHKRRFETSQ